MDQIEDALRRLELIERAQAISDRNHTDMSKTITGLINEQSKTKDVLDILRTDRAVREERDKNINARFDQIEKSIKRIYDLGWWILAAFGSALILLVARFLFSGGFNV
jgi:hypothetical protein